MRAMRSMLLSSVILALLLGVASPAIAKSDKKTPPDSDPIVTWYTIEEVHPDGTETLVYAGDDLAEFNAAPDVSVMAEVPGSKTVTYKITTYGLIGTLYRMYNKLSWKWDSLYRCYLVSRSGWGEAVAAGWSYVGLVDNRWWGTGTNYITSRYKGKFHYAAGIINYDMYSGIEVQGWTGGSSVCKSY
ncbi:MAG: hypothetical protein IBX63_11570 [Coriobacteriia bacterium]|nr:hypothetical protein [Coriobacteriia bacterium]